MFVKTITFFFTWPWLFLHWKLVTFVAQKGCDFFVIKLAGQFLFSDDWSPSDKFGALPMILGSFVVTLTALVATPLPLKDAIFMTEFPLKGLNSTTRWTFGQDSIRCLWICYWSPVVDPFVRLIFGGTGFDILSVPLYVSWFYNRNLYDNRCAIWYHYRD